MTHPLYFYPFSWAISATRWMEKVSPFVCTYSNKASPSCFNLDFNTNSSSPISSDIFNMVTAASSVFPIWFGSSWYREMISSAFISTKFSEGTPKIWRVIHHTPPNFPCVFSAGSIMHWSRGWWFLESCGEDSLALSSIHQLNDYLKYLPITGKLRSGKSFFTI